MLANDAPIHPGDPGTKAIGFTPERFSSDSYLWAKDEGVWISLIISKAPGRGHFSQMVRALETAGYNVIMPTPLGKMPLILNHLGFEPGVIGDCEVWTRTSEQKAKP